MQRYVFLSVCPSVCLSVTRQEE